VLDEYKETGPPEMSDQVKEEISNWLNLSEEEQMLTKEEINEN